MKKSLLMVMAVVGLTSVAAKADGMVSFWVDGDGVRLPECGGYVSTKVITNYDENWNDHDWDDHAPYNYNNESQQVQVMFEDVENCSNFDIVRANGEFTDHPNMKFEGALRHWYGTYTVAKRYMEFGPNTITLRVKSNSGKHMDFVTVHFLAF